MQSFKKSIKKIKKINTMVIVNKWLVKLISGGFARAVAVYPFIFLADKEHSQNEVLMNHERIHHRQQLELLVLPFLFTYGLYYLKGRVKGLSHYDAYLNISFEKEAYHNQWNQNYLKRRSFMAFRKYQ